MDLNLGLKLWNTNQNYIKSAKELYEKNIYDYIELYITPNSIEFLPMWQELRQKTGIKFAIHAPHYSSGFDFSSKKKEKSNLIHIALVKEYAKALDAIYCIFHPGIGGDVKESIRQMKMVDFDFLLENKPFIVPLEKDKNGFCVGASFEEIRLILDEVKCGFCLDVGHCACSANYQKIDIYDYIKKLNTLKPKAYHISDNDKNSVYDAHYHFGDGSFDFDKILSIIDTTKPIAIETIKDSKENLDDFYMDCKFLKGGDNARSGASHRC